MTKQEWIEALAERAMSIAVDLDHMDGDLTIEMTEENREIYKQAWEQAVELKAKIARLSE